MRFANPDPVEYARVLAAGLRQQRGGISEPLLTSAASQECVRQLIIVLNCNSIVPEHKQFVWVLFPPPPSPFAEDKGVKFNH